MLNGDDDSPLCRGENRAALVRETANDKKQLPSPFVRSPNGASCGAFDKSPNEDLKVVPTSTVVRSDLDARILAKGGRDDSGLKPKSENGWSNQGGEAKPIWGTDRVPATGQKEMYRILYLVGRPNRQHSLYQNLLKN